MIAALPLILSGIQAAIQAAPQVEAVIVGAKNWIVSLVAGGVIPAEQQDALHAHIDATALAFANGQTPPEFAVAPDPAS